MLDWAASLFSGSVSTYVIAGLLCAFCVMGGLYKCEKDARLVAEQNLAVAVEVNKANDAAIASLKDFGERTDKAITLYTNSQDDINTLRRSLTSSMQKLIISNETFKTWAATIIPSDASGLYNQSAGDSTAPNNGNQTSTIPFKAD